MIPFRHASTLTLDTQRETPYARPSKKRVLINSTQLINSTIGLLVETMNEWNALMRRKDLIMKSMLFIPIFLFVLLSFAQLVPAQDFFVFPSQGQSQQQMDRDKVECQIWAQQQTGFDPLATPRATAPPPSREAPQGGLVRGAARGAVVAVVGGAIAGDAEEGLQGIQDGFGWTIAIMEDTGRMVLTASGDLVGDVAFGVCTPY